ncbi:MAG: aconitate hydratase, partial [Alphaproteobacteria bacterium]|nr:aconitate hydratase [Alphaproteobacteria bacterium]
MTSRDSFAARRTLTVGASTYDYFSLPAAADIGDITRLPYSLKILLENLLRHEDGTTVTAADIRALGNWGEARCSDREIAFFPARVLMPDSSGTPLIADLSAIRDAMAARGGNADAVNPQISVDLVLDHSIIADFAGSADAAQKNIEIEFDRNRERYAFLRWAQRVYRNLRIVPPGNGILHQINLEFLARVVWTEQRGDSVLAHPDTLVGMDSHTPMVNALSVLGWGVGGIEAGAAMLGEPISLLIPQVVGCRLIGQLRAGVTCTDLVLTLTQKLRQIGVTGKLVEYFGPGLAALPLADRATVANMAPEYGATMGFFPIDRETIRYLAF